MRNGKLTIAIALIFCVCSMYAQQNNGEQSSPANTMPYDPYDHLVWGGNLGLQFGSQTMVDVSPIVGYKVTDRFVPGIGATYRYVRWNYPGYLAQASVYGGSIWARYYVIESIFAHAEYEGLNGEWDPYLFPGKRYVLTSMLLGGGYSENFGGMSSYVMLLYNLSWNYDSPYDSPLILRVGFTVGI